MISLQRFTNCSIENKQLNGMVAHPAKPNIYAEKERKMHDRNNCVWIRKFQEKKRQEEYSSQFEKTMYCPSCHHMEDYGPTQSECDLITFWVVDRKLICSMCDSVVTDYTK